MLGFLLVAPLVGACNRELQADVGVLLDALATDDYPKFLTIAGAELAAEVDEAKLHDLAATYARLGPEQDRTRTALAVSHGVHSVHYTLEHPRGEVYLVATSRGDQLDGFEITGAWTLAFADRTREAVAAILTAVEADDRAGLRALVHADIDDAAVERLRTELRTLGPHAEVTPIADDPQAFRVRYAKATIVLGVNLRAQQVSGLHYRSE